MYILHILRVRPAVAEAYCAVSSPTQKFPQHSGGHDRLIAAYNDPAATVVLQSCDYPQELYRLTNLRGETCECGSGDVLVPIWEAIS